MSNFFDLKARRAAAAGAGPKKKDGDSKEQPRMQPWVEK